MALHTFELTPENVCCRKIIVTLDDDNVVRDLKFIGGCSGNTQGVARLSVGHSKEELIALLSGIKCPGSRTHMTSCPDQLSRCLKEID